eukprot:CAMPEP_0179368930 /NCGR_PEP_ID=MMETSP0797-20121207/84361_1 /TAXON_ID=47934 /ORGANISM="Dinophysis acuminata, Strain DAEP01" /LENGTH=74 /DNA_ID=CAMNT_0021084561 /DNA_START=113 /DNA_END=333 /DNA_ORIENTATION=-
MSLVGPAPGRWWEVLSLATLLHGGVPSPRAPAWHAPATASLSAAPAHGLLARLWLHLLCRVAACGGRLASLDPA